MKMYDKKVIYCLNRGLMTSVLLLEYLLVV